MASVGARTESESLAALLHRFGAAGIVSLILLGLHAVSQQTGRTKDDGNVLKRNANPGAPRMLNSLIDADLLSKLRPCKNGSMGTRVSREFGGI